MKVLAIDSSSKCCTVAIVNSEIVEGEISYNNTKEHSSVIMNLIDDVLKNTKNKLSDIDGFCVSKGPGSFTGLRIGMATIKGLAHSENKPIVEVSTLDSIANNFPFSKRIICPIFDALRNNVYTAFYTFIDGSLFRLTDYLNISIEETITLLSDSDKLLCKMNNFLEKDVFDSITSNIDFFDILENHNRIIAGDDFEKFIPFFEGMDNLDFAPNYLNLPKASSLGNLGIKKLKENLNISIHSISPMYLRESQAEREYINTHGKSVYED